MSEVAFLIKQVDKDGDETGLVRIADGRTSARRFIRSCGGTGRLDSIDSMEPGSFDPIVSGGFIYEVECFDRKEIGDQEVDRAEVIGPHAYDVYEVRDGVLEPRYAFGEEDLFGRLEEAGMSRKDFGGMVPKEPGEEAEATLTDPVRRQVRVKSLTDDEIARKSGDAEFKAALTVAQSLAESAEEKDEEYGGFRIRTSELGYGRNEYVISLPDGRWVETVHGYGDREKAEKAAKAVIDSRPPEFVATLRSLGAVKEAAGDKEEFDYCQRRVKVEVKDGRAVATIGPCVKGRLNESGHGGTCRLGWFKTVDEAAEAARFGIDSGVCESSSGTLRMIEFPASLSSKAHEAVDDNPYLSNNVRWISANTVEFMDDADESMTAEMVEQLDEFGISEEEYDVTDVEDFDEGSVEKVAEFSLNVARQAQKAIDDYGVENSRWIGSNVLTFLDDADDSVEVAIRERLKDAGIPEEEYEIRQGMTGEFDEE